MKHSYFCCRSVLLIHKASKVANLTYQDKDNTWILRKISAKKKDNAKVRLDFKQQALFDTHSI